MFTLYKIYYGEELAYLGRTRQPLTRRLYGHFFKAKLQKSLDLFKVSRIESAQFATCADMYLYEIYYINKLRPLLNRDDLAPDALTITLPEVAFAPFTCELMDKWKVEVIVRQEEARKRKAQQRAKRAAAKAGKTG